MADYPTSQLIPILRKILSKLQDVVSQLELKNKNDAQSYQAAARERDQTSDTTISLAPVVIDSLPALSQDEISYKGEKRARERKRFTVEKWTLAVLFAYAGLTGIQACLTKKALQETGRSADAAERAAAAAEKQLTLAQQSLGATIDSFHQDQRAWVGTIGTEVLKDKDGNLIGFRVEITNSGKTPALEMNSIATTAFGPTLFHFVPQYPKEPSTPIESIKSRAVLQPGAKFFIISNSKPQDPRSFQSGESIFYFFGRIYYKDVFKRNHLTTFCFVLRPNLSDMDSCDQYNFAD
jgi:hypothetical protein